MKILLYGDPGSTKTRTSGSAALVEEMSPVLYLDASGNPESLWDYPNKPDVISMEDLKDFNAPYDWLLRGQPIDHPFRQHFELEHGGDDPYKTLIIDQLTDVQRLSFKKVLHADKILPGDVPQKREWEHYNKVLYQMANFAKMYYSLPMHVIMTCLEERKTDQTGAEIGINLHLEGKSAEVIPSYALLVGRMVSPLTLGTLFLKQLEKDGYGTPKHSVMILKPSKKFIAKNQYGNLPDYVCDPMMDLIHTNICGETK